MAGVSGDLAGIVFLILGKIALLSILRNTFVNMVGGGTPGISNLPLRCGNHAQAVGEWISRPGSVCGGFHGQPEKSAKSERG
jgi:hypothetical protein